VTGCELIPAALLTKMVSTKKPNHAVHIKRNTVYSEGGKVIVFLTARPLKEMLYMKERGKNPANLIMDAVERFYIEWE